MALPDIVLFASYHLQHVISLFEIFKCRNLNWSHVFFTLDLKLLDLINFIVVEGLKKYVTDTFRCPMNVALLDVNLRLELAAQLVCLRIGLVHDELSLLSVSSTSNC